MGATKRNTVKVPSERIVHEMTFEEMAKKYGIPVSKMREMFAVILFKIEKSHGRAFSSLLRQINTWLEAKQFGIEEDSTDLRYKNIFWN